VTPAIKLARKHKIPFNLHQYQHNTNADSYGQEAADALGLNPARVFKTLVIQLNNSDLIVGIVPVSGSLNLKATASVANAKKAVMAYKLKVQTTTGYVLGGISPLGQRR